MDFDEQFFEIQPHGKLFVLRLPEGKSLTSEWPVTDHLRRYHMAPKPFVGVVVDIGDNAFSFDAGDLTSLFVVSTNAAAKLAGGFQGVPTSEPKPCVVVIRGESAQRLRASLKLLAPMMGNTIQVTDSFDSAVALARAQLEASGGGYPALMAGSSRASEQPVVNNEAVRAAEPRPAPTKEPPTDDEPQESSPPFIFLAHASEDKDAVRRLYSQLKSSGLRPWLDEIDLLPGQNWPVEIPNAIDRSDIFIACLSKRSVQKQGYVQKEFRLALNEYAERPPGSIYLIPAKLDDCEVPDLQLPHMGISLRDIQWIELWKENGFERLVNVIQNRHREPEHELKAPRRKAAGVAVRIVDISFSGDLKDSSGTKRADNPVWMRSRGDFVQVDLKLRNVSSEVAFLKSVIIHVDQLWHLEGFGYVGAAIPPSAEYDVVLPIQQAPFSLRQSISQSIEPNGVDRFLLTLHPEHANFLFVTRLEIVYDEDNKSVTSSNIIFATRGGPFTFPTASEQMLLEMDRAVAENDPHLKSRWVAARERVSKNNQIRKATAKLDGVRNEIVASFEQGEPIVHGF